MDTLSLPKVYTIHWRHLRGAGQPNVKRRYGHHGEKPEKTWRQTYCRGEYYGWVVICDGFGSADSEHGLCRPERRLQYRQISAASTTA